MNLPNLPTDNLYKFMALSGLTISLLASAFLIHRYEVNRSNGAEIRVGKEALEYWTNEWVQRSERVVDQLETTAESLNKQNAIALESSEADIERFAKTLLAARSEFDSIREAARNDLLEKSMRLRKRSELADVYHSTTESLSLPLSIAITLGVLLSIVGFWLWYWKLQRFQDTAVRSAASNDRSADPSNGQSS